MPWGRRRHHRAGGQPCDGGEGRKEEGLSGHLQQERGSPAVGGGAEEEQVQSPQGKRPGVCEGVSQASVDGAQGSRERVGGDTRGKKGAHPLGPHLGPQGGKCRSSQGPRGMGTAEQKQDGA